MGEEEQIKTIVAMRFKDHPIVTTTAVAAALTRAPMSIHPGTKAITIDAGMIVPNTAGAVKMKLISISDKRVVAGKVGQ